MNIVFLAAGVGSRFNDKVNNKILLKINKNQRILDVLINNLSKLDINKKIIVLGHNALKLKKKLSNKNLFFIYNKYFKKKDMLHTLIMGLKSSNDDTIISYTDIIYSTKLIKKIIQKKNKNILLPVKTNWQKIWKIRGKYNSDDAESLNYDKKLKLKEIGRKINKNTKGQFMGLVYIPKGQINNVLNYYEKIKHKRMQTTSFIEFLIKNKIMVNVLPNNEPWYEFDDDDDLKNFTKCNDKFF